MTRRHRRIVGCLAATATLAPLTIGALASPALAGSKPQPQPHQHTICHATSSAKNPYVLIHPASAGVMHGHLGDHHHDAKDIIPPFEYKGEVYSQNWDADGMAIYDNGCAVPEKTPELTPPPAEEPPAALPPIVVEPPAEEPPAEEPPAEEPPAEEPPGEPLPDEPAPGTFGF